MEEDLLSDAIYGDLGDFEFGEKLKEQNKEIENLTERLNQSVIAITDLENEVKKLKKENRILCKNNSSLLLTAKSEVNRKLRDIAELKQKNDNRLFRRQNWRPNSCSIAVQTDPDPSFHSNVNNNNVNNLEREECKHLNVDKCTQDISATSEKPNNTHDLSKFRIPKKNPLARRNHIEESTNRNSSYDQPRHHIPKKNPSARCFNGNDAPRLIRKDMQIEKSRPRDLREEINDSRRRSPVMHSSSKQREWSNFNSKSDDQNRHCRRNGRKHSRDRSASKERDRHRKRHRSDSTSNDYRSKSRTSRNDEKRSRTKSPKKRNSKPPKEDRRGDDKPTEEFASNLKEKELEAMLIAQKKVLDEMNSKNGDGHLELKENSSRERRKEENSNTADKLANDERNEDILNSVNEVTDPVAIPIADESANHAPVVETESKVNEKDSNGLDFDPDVLPVVTIEKLPSTHDVPSTKNDSNPELPSIVTDEIVAAQEPKSTCDSPSATNNSNPEVPPTASDEVVAAQEPKSMDIPPPTTNSNQELASINNPMIVDVDATPTNDPKPMSPLKTFTSIKDQSELTDKGVETNTVAAVNKFQNNGNSNSQMDVDYELMEQTSGENRKNLSSEEKNKASQIENQTSVVENPSNVLSSTQINASFIAMTNGFDEKSFAEATLNSSHELHVLSKSSKYVVQDVGHEIQIFLTKKRKKNKNNKCKKTTVTG